MKDAQAIFLEHVGGKAGPCAAVYDMREEERELDLLLSINHTPLSDSLTQYTQMAGVEKQKA